MKKIFLLAFIFTTLTLAQNKIAITIDDLPFVRISALEKDQLKNSFDKLVGKLKEKNVPAIGFVNEGKLYVKDSLVESRVSLLQDWLNAGLELGNHTYSHKSANQISVEEYTQDILRGEKVLKPLINNHNQTLRYFRHPFLQTGLSLQTKKQIEEFLHQHNYIIAPVTIDNSEWIYAAAFDKALTEHDEPMMDKIGQAYITYMKDKLVYWENQSNALFGRNISHILLIHANNLNAEYFDKLYDMIISKNYLVVSLEESLKDEAYKSDDTFIKNNGISWLHRWAITQGKKKDFFGNEPETDDWIKKYSNIDYE